MSNIVSNLLSSIMSANCTTTPLADGCSPVPVAISETPFNDATTSLDRFPPSALSKASFQSAPKSVSSCCSATIPSVDSRSASMGTNARLTARNRPRLTLSFPTAPSASARSNIENPFATSVCPLASRASRAKSATVSPVASITFASHARSAAISGVLAILSSSASTSCCRPDSRVKRSVFFRGNTPRGFATFVKWLFKYSNNPLAFSSCTVQSSIK